MITKPGADHVGEDERRVEQAEPVALARVDEDRDQERDREEDD